MRRVPASDGPEAHDRGADEDRGQREPEPEVRRPDPEVPAAQRRLRLAPDQQPRDAGEDEAGQGRAQQPRLDVPERPVVGAEAAQHQDDRVDRDGDDGEVGGRAVELGEVGHGAQSTRGRAKARQSRGRTAPSLAVPLPGGRHRGRHGRPRPLSARTLGPRGPGRRAAAHATCDAAARRRRRGPVRGLLGRRRPGVQGARQGARGGGSGGLHGRERRAWRRGGPAAARPLDRRARGGAPTPGAAPRPAPGQAPAQPAPAPQTAPAPQQAPAPAPPPVSGGS